jgi:serine O-acetyltransferase
MKIGKGTSFAYGGIAVVIHKRAVIGDNVMIGQCVTIGGRSKKINVPIIRSNIYIGAGSRILGDVIIGNNVIIGANSVVINNVPDNSVVAGIPAKIIKNNITYSDYI